MSAETVRDQDHANQNEEGESQHFQGRVTLDEVCRHVGCKIHDSNRDADCRRHDLDVLRETNRRDDRIRLKRQGP